MASSQQSRARVLGDVPPSSGLNRCAKRLFDIIVATAGLVLFSPIILVACVAIKLDSRGPIFVWEARYGHKSWAIWVLRFRSVTADAEASQVNSCVTRVGQILRRSGIDGLPQLFNVLRGDMSIVGPRPFAHRRDLFENSVLNSVKPGLTGWAQLAESREGFRTTEQRIKDDVFYAKNQSLLLDIKIILMTLISPKTNSSTDR